MWVWLETRIERLGHSLSTPEGRRAVLSALIGRLRWLLRLMFAVFVLLALVFLGVVEWVGERNVFTTFFLFLPAQVWFVPLALFFAACVPLLDWRLGIAILCTTGAFVFFYLDWEMSGPKRGKGGEELVAMTYNRGERVGSLQPFKDLHKPDIIAMQEAGNQSASYARAEGYAEFPHAQDIGEFMILSKHPIMQKGLLEFEVDGSPHAVAAWFVVDFSGTEIVIYNVHLDTPRDQLRAFRRGAFLRGLLPFSDKTKAYQRFWDNQIELAGRLLGHIEAETRPLIVVGDLNTPDRGYIYRRFAGALHDSHEKAGHGFGWTFPGTTRNPLTLFGPWLRIDHQFASEQWRVLDSHAEAERKSQHRAVAARFELVRTSPN